ncbi:hypothetical protein OIE66_02300 [Nonomuraea sp. NBC_01738]|uniref:hypothetical protein n=1 Tax=Nonomuraea sp. NBC_01738 TaxID=2976003 RepID=UPI002E11A370|nr:hypothetical protein OIE66_02300 [Nonomuraea sp. NBC_01738]
MATGSRVVVSLAATISVAAVVLVVAGTVIAGRARPALSSPATPRPSLLWSPGACVTRDGARYDLTPCNGGVAEVLTIVADPPARTACPDDTDDVLSVGEGRAACVRNFLEPHPGRSGGGGGVLRTGDCVALDGRERPCSSPGWYGRAAALTATPESCPAGTLDTLTADDAVVCLGRGGKVLDTGTCVAEPADTAVARSAITQVSCADDLAWARVTSFETSPRSCPAGSDRYLEARGAFRPVTCLHLVSK